MIFTNFFKTNNEGVSYNQSYFYKEGYIVAKCQILPHIEVLTKIDEESVVCFTNDPTTMIKPDEMSKYFKTDQSFIDALNADAIEIEYASDFILEVLNTETGDSEILESCGIEGGMSGFMKYMYSLENVEYAMDCIGALEFL